MARMTRRERGHVPRTYCCRVIAAAEVGGALTQRCYPFRPSPRIHIPPTFYCTPSTLPTNGELALTHGLVTDSIDEIDMSAAPSRNQTGITALILGATGIGFAPLFVRMSELGPFATAAHRMILASPLLWLWSRWESRAHPGLRQPRAAADFLWMGLVGFFFSGDMALWNWSLHLTTVANSTLITNLTPLIVMITARVLFGEPITKYYLLGMPIALAGVILMVRSTSPALEDHWKGDLVSVGALLFYAGYLLALRRLRILYSSAAILCWSGLFSAAMLSLVAVAAGEPLLPSSPVGWLPLLALAGISHVGGQGFIAYGFGHVSASVGALVLLVQPVVAMILAWGLLSEPLAPIQCLGALTVLAGITIACRKPERATEDGTKSG